MGVSTGQIFQPKIMSVVEPQKRESTWEQVLPSIISSVAQTAVNSYVKNKLGEGQNEKEMLLKGWTKDPNTGQWLPPTVSTQDLGNNITGVMQGGELKHAYRTDPYDYVKGAREERLAANQDRRLKLDAATAAGLAPDTSSGLTAEQAIDQGKWKPFTPKQTIGEGGTVLTETKPGSFYVNTGQVQEEVDAEGNKIKIYPDGAKKIVGKVTDKTQPTAFSDQNAYTQIQKFSDIEHPYSDIAQSLSNVYGKIRKTEKSKPDEAFSEINSMGQVVTQYSQAYPTREAVADAYIRGELPKDEAKALEKYYRYGGSPLKTQPTKSIAPVGPVQEDSTSKLKRILGFGGG